MNTSLFEQVSEDYTIWLGYMRSWVRINSAKIVSNFCTRQFSNELNDFKDFKLFMT